jgi:hypothetical protein
MHGDRAAFPFLLHVGAVHRELFHHPPVLPDLADAQAEQFGDAKPRLEAEDEPRAIPEGLGSTETPAQQRDLWIRKWPTAFHGVLPFVNVRKWLLFLHSSTAKTNDFAAVQPMDPCSILLANQ